MMYSVANALVSQVQAFTHPAIGSVDVRAETIDDFCWVDVQLFDRVGRKVMEEHGNAPYALVPGCRFKVPERGDFIHIERMYVLPEYHGRHIGTQLFKWMEDCARRHGVMLLTLEADTETGAMSYWRKQGFSVVQENVMAKDLSPLREFTSL